MESTRRLVIAATLGVAVIALAAISDFLFGSFWSSHAMLTSLIASLLVLAVTVVVLNEALDRRDRRRWSVLAQYVLFQLVQCARASWMGIVELVDGHEVETGSTEGLLVGARLSHNEPTEARTLHHRKLARSSIAAEHAGGVAPDWLHDQIVASTQLAVRLDYESRALGLKLVPLAWWAERTQSFVSELSTPGG